MDPSFQKKRDVSGKFNVPDSQKTSALNVNIPPLLIEGGTSVTNITTNNFRTLASQIIVVLDPLSPQISQKITVRKEGAEAMGILKGHFNT